MENWSQGHARALLAIENPEKQLNIFIKSLLKSGRFITLEKKTSGAT